MNNNQWLARHASILRAITIEKGVARLAIILTKTMAKQFSTILPCVDAKVTTNDKVVEQVKTYKGSFEVQDDDHVSFIEDNTVHVIHPELHWRLLDRTLHGRMSVNANHVKVEFYIRHGDYVSEKQLADMLSSEIETMGESLCEMDLKEEVAQCAK